MNKMEMMGTLTQESSNKENIKNETECISKEEMESMESQELVVYGKERQKKSRFKKALCAITAGIMLISATPVFSQESQDTELRELYEKLHTLQEQERWLNLMKRMLEEKVNEGDEEAKDTLLQITDSLTSTIEAEELFEEELRKKLESAESVTKNERIIAPEDSLKQDPTLNSPKETKKEQILMGGVEIITPDNVKITPESKELLESWGGSIYFEESVIYLGGKSELEFDIFTKEVRINNDGDNTLIVICEDVGGQLTIVTVVDKVVTDIQEIE